MADAMEIDERSHPMDATRMNRQSNPERRYRLAANTNETIVDDSSDDQDVEGHRLATNDTEIVIDQMRRFTGDDDEPTTDVDGLGPNGIRAR